MRGEYFLKPLMIANDAEYLEDLDDCNDVCDQLCWPYGTFEEPEDPNGPRVNLKAYAHFKAKGCSQESILDAMGVTRSQYYSTKRRYSPEEADCVSGFMDLRKLIVVRKNNHIDMEDVMKLRRLGMPIKAIASKYGVTYSTIWGRIYRYGKPARSKSAMLEDW